jgi:small subunit ribosomal protein S13
MIYFLRRQFDSKLKVRTALLKSFGLNFPRVLYIFRRMGFHPSISFQQLSSLKIQELDRFISSTFLIDRGLSRITRNLLSDFLKSGNYRALRMKQGLPSRGQRTHTNAGTARRMRDVRERDIKKKV